MILQLAIPTTTQYFIFGVKIQTRHFWVIFIHCDRDKVSIPVTIIVEFVVTCIGQMNTKSCSARIKDLHGRISPYFRFGQRRQIRNEVEMNPFHGSGQH